MQTTGLSTGSRLTALLMADMVGYSRLMEEDDQSALAAIRELKDTYLEPVVQNHSGEILKRLGDGWIFAFNSVSDLALCAIEVQSSLANHPMIKLRMGGHIGEILEDKDDFYGAGVNLTQRLQSEAPPGGVIISEVVYLQLAANLRSKFSDAGVFKLKNISLPVSAYRWRSLGNLSKPAEELAHSDSVPTVVVPVFESAPNNEEIQSIANDIHDGLVSRLSRRTGLRVLGGESDKDIPDSYRLHGRVRIAGDRGRVHIKLEGNSRSLSFFKSYESSVSDVFSFTDEMVDNLDYDLRIQINAFDSERISHLPEDSLSVSELRTRAAGFYYMGTLSGYEHGLRLAETALRMNPEDPMALAMRAIGRISPASARHETMDPRMVEQLATDLDQAIELEPRSDFIFATRARFRVLITRDAEGALSDALRARQLGPSFTQGHLSNGLANLLKGDLGTAREIFEVVLARGSDDPYLAQSCWYHAIACYLLEDYEASLESIEKALQLLPRQWSFYALQALCCRESGDKQGADEAQSMAERYPRLASIMTQRPPLPDRYNDFVDQFKPAD